MAPLFFVPFRFIHIGFCQGIKALGESRLPFSPLSLPHRAYLCRSQTADATHLLQAGFTRHAGAFSYSTKIIGEHMQCSPINRESGAVGQCRTSGQYMLGMDEHPILLSFSVAIHEKQKYLYFSMTYIEFGGFPQGWHSPRNSKVERNKTLPHEANQTLFFTLGETP